MIRSLMRSAKNAFPERLRHRIDRQIDTHRFGAKYLEDQGWFESSRSLQSVGVQGAPTPWITYPAFKMLERIVRPSHKIFEYGTGNSSLWWSSKANLVAAVEHNPDWSDIIKEKAPGNLSVALRREGEAASDEHRYLIDSFLSEHPSLPSLGDRKSDIGHGLNCVDFGAYAAEPAKYGKGFFDIFVVDGMARSLCAHVAAELITDNGIIIWDNSDRRQYNPGFAGLGKLGWKRIDFYGPGPVGLREWCTSIFCRNINWLPQNLSLPMCQLSDLDE